MPKPRVSSSTSASSERSRKPCARRDPEVGRWSRYLAEASLAVLRACSAEVPPITTARWYGGQAEVPIRRSFSSRKRISEVGFSSALVSWYRYDLLALPPPLAMYSSL